MNEDIPVSYYAIIPADVRYDTNVCPNAKLLYGEITALCNRRGYCWANNSYFAELYNVSKTSISKWISQLIENGYVVSTIQYKDGTKEILNRYLRIVSYPIEEKLSTPIEEKLKDNTTSFNNTFNNTLEKNKRFSIKPFATYTKNPDLLSTINDFVEMRKKIKSPMTDRAIILMLKKLDDLASDDETKIAILNQSILNSWKGIFPLKDNKDSFSKNGRQPGFTQEGHAVEDYSKIIDF